LNTWLLLVGVEVEVEVEALVDLEPVPLYLLLQEFPTQ
jgi:hypothetical protein